MAGPEPTVPATTAPPRPKATADTLVALLVESTQRLARLETQVERLERRFDSTETRTVALYEGVALLTMLAGRLPDAARIAWIVLAADAALLLLVGVVLAVARHWPALLSFLA